MRAEYDEKEINDVIQNTIARVIIGDPLFINASAHLGIKISRSVETAAVTEDGWLVINPDFFMPLNSDEKTLVIAHEFAHALLEHIPRGKDFSDKDVFNKAADVHANIIARIVTEKSKKFGEIDIDKFWSRLWTPERVIRLASFANIELKKYPDQMTTEELYNLLKMMKNYGLFGNDEKDSDCEMCSGRDIKPSGKNIDGEVLRKPDKTFENGEEGWKKIFDDAYADALRNMQTGRGSVLGKVIIDIVESKRKIKWSRVIRDFMEKDWATRIRSFRRPSRRFRRDKLIHPGSQRVPAPNLLVLIDVSGSMDDEEINVGLNEVHGFIEKYKGKTLAVQWDDGVVSVRLYRKELSFVRNGFGGTSLCQSWEDFKTNYRKDYMMMKGAYVLIISDFMLADTPDEFEVVVHELRSYGKMVIFYDTYTGKITVNYKKLQEDNDG